MDFIGRYTNKVDAKGRVPLPAKFEKDLSEDLIITLDPTGRCIYVFEVEDFNEWVKSFFGSEGFNASNRKHVEIRSALKGRAQDVTVDASRRILIPAAMREKVSIGSQARFIGNDGYIEIWDPDMRDEFEQSIDLASMIFSD